MPVKTKTAIKPYCYLTPLDTNCCSIYLHNGETTRLSHEGQIVSPTEDPELIHIRVKPDVVAKTLSTIYVSNYKGCWINGCVALCWYRYTLNHGHIIRLQPEGYEYQVNFFPPPHKEVADLLLLKIPKSLTEIPKKVMDELVCEAKLEYFEEKLRARTVKPPAQEVGADEQRIEKKPPVPEKTKKKAKRKCSRGKKPKKPPTVEASKPDKKHVHFKTRPKPPQMSEAEEQALKTMDYLATTAAQTSDDTYIMERSTSLVRKVIFSAEARESRLHKKHVDKSVKFIAETGSEKNVVIVEPDEDLLDDELETSKSGIFEMVLELYGRMREEEREYATDRSFVMYLLDRILRRMYRLNTSDVKFMRDLLDSVVENAVTMKERDLAMAKKVIDDVVDRVFVSRRKSIEEGFFEKLLGDIFSRIDEPEHKQARERRKVVEVVESSSSDDDSTESNEGEANKPSVVKVVYEFD